MSWFKASKKVFVQRELRPDVTFDLGIPTEQIPNAFYTYSLNLSGRKMYIVCGKQRTVFVDQTVLQFQRTLSMMEVDLNSKVTITYDFDIDDTVDNIVDLYFLAKDLAVLLTFDMAAKQLVQHRVRVDRRSRVVCCDLIRRTAFDAPLGIRVGIGAGTEGYVMVVGRTSREMGDVCKARLMAADPMHADQFTEFDLDDQIIQLERMAHMHPAELYIWPKSVPLLFKQTMFFLMAKQRGFSLIFDSSHLGVISFNKETGAFECRVQDVQDSELSELHPDMNVNFGCMVAQKREHMWLTFVSPAPPNHWRWKLKFVVTLLCYSLLHVVGRFLIWFGQFDGGFAATKFLTLYLRLVGPTLAPDLGPSPTLRLVNLNLDKLQCRAYRFNAKRESLSRFGQVLIDCTPRGDLVLSEMPSRATWIRVHRCPNPHQPRSLERLSKAKLEKDVPRLFLHKRLPRHILETKSSTLVVPTWDFRHPQTTSITDH